MLPARRRRRARRRGWIGLVTSWLIGNVQGHAATELDSTGGRWNLMIRHHASKPDVCEQKRPERLDARQRWGPLYPEHFGLIKPQAEQR